MIFPISNIIPIKDQYGHKHLVAQAIDKNTGMPYLVSLFAFEDREDLKEGIGYFSQKLMQIYSRYDAMGMGDPDPGTEKPTTKIPDFMNNYTFEGLEP